MIVALTDIPTRGLTVRLDAAPWARQGAAEGLGGELQAFAGELLVTRHGAHVAVRGELSGMASLACDRCRAPLLVSVGGDVSCVYSPLSTLPERKDDDEGLPRPPVELPFEVADVGEFDGQSLDLGEVVREWFTVERPSRLVCADVDPADDEPCRARFRALARAVPDETVDPRFAILTHVNVKE